MNLPHLQQIEPQWFFPFFLFMWVAAVALLSIKSGWHELAQQYRATADVVGEQFRMVSGSFGASPFPVNYGGCLLVTVGTAGFGLSVFLLFRINHPNLFVPWSAIERVEQDRYFLRKRTNVFVRGFDKRISLYGAVGECVARGFKKARGVEAR